QKQKKLIMLPSETMIWQPEFTDKTLSRKPGAVQDVASHYSAEELAKVKKRKTGNLSKRSRLSEVDPDLIAK
ncbi:hypothetical protein ACVUSJ_22895, partial [Escherichia coli]